MRLQTSSTHIHNNNNNKNEKFSNPSTYMCVYQKTKMYCVETKSNANLFQLKYSLFEKEQNNPKRLSEKKTFKMVI